jgi:hypothetical protein
MDEVFFYGSRYNDTWIKKDAYLGDTTYLSKNENTFKQVVYSNDTYETSELTEASYEEALKSFLVVSASNITKDWVDQTDIENRLYVGVSYRIFDAYYGDFIQINLGNNVTIRDVYIGFVRSIYSYTTLNISISVDIDLVPHTLTYSMYGFNQIDGLEEPKPLESISLETLIQLASFAEQYASNQYKTIEDVRYWVTKLYRDKTTYLFIESLETSTYQTKMYGFEDDNYQVIDGLENNTSETRVIDEQTYIDDLEKVVWLDLSKLLNVLIASNSSDLSLIQLSEEDFLNIVSQTIIDTYTFVIGQVTIFNGGQYENNYFFFVELILLSKETNVETTLEVEYSDIGEVTLDLGQ